MSRLNVFIPDLARDLSRQVVFLDPLLWYPGCDRWGYAPGEAPRWWEAGWEYIARVDTIQAADYVVFPHYFIWDDLPDLQSIASRAREFSRSVIVFQSSDISLDIPCKNLVIFRRSLTAPKKPYEYALASFPRDISQELSHEWRPSQSLAISYTGYLGHAGDIRSRAWFYTLLIARIIVSYAGFLAILRHIPREYPLHMLSWLWVGKYARHEAVKICASSAVLPLSLIERRHGLYFGAPEHMRQEYIQNMYDHIFALVTRGNGNYSFRLYEVMSMGRIPVFFDTDCTLPFEDILPFRELFVWVPWADRRNTDIYLRQYLEKHALHLDCIQQQIRELYQKYFLPEKYFVYIAEQLISSHEHS